MRLLPDAAASLGIALVVSSHTPLLLLDAKLMIIAASSSFCSLAGLAAANVARRPLLELGNGEWCIPQLDALLRGTASGSAAIDSYECDLVRPGLPPVNLMVHAHKLDFPSIPETYVVVALANVTHLHRAEKVRRDLARDKQNLLHELQHRVANSLQIIASVLMQSARRVQSEEASVHLQDAHHRVMSIATLERMLAARGDADVVLITYLSDICASIAASMIVDRSQLRLLVSVDDTRTSADVSVSIGLIVTELVINALKHGYPRPAPKGTISVAFHSNATGWELVVQDDGVGMPDPALRVKPGLGTGIVEALARQLEAAIVVSDANPGARITLTYVAAPTADPPQPAMLV